MSTHRRQYTKEEKLLIVNESLETGADINLIAQNYHLHPNTIYKWKRQYITYEHNAFAGHGNKVMTDQEREIAELKKQLRESELQNEILKKAVGIFSSPHKISLLS